ncbi:uncharacterized protein EI90DRAFT_1411639 [Cantharellus anzutake]|uniref:uncharacterized protein n=1 Tax=Cantharellus anzutake TaxID=1750568 RepID=UPI0019048F19|nr:uncharacterized protein EI90DRAFT_1411639 [Cantharellus anzutake]KAF8329562.1 hypothetical protein EI90DRAFT_1411639 [Cantharellus anzutake]
MASLDLPQKGGGAVYSTPAARRHHNASAFPDLRFEQSYLKSISPFISSTSTSSNEDKSTQEKHLGGTRSSQADPVHQPLNEVVIEQSLYGVPISVKWRRVLWMTTRDQIFSPFIQGALW